VYFISILYTYQQEIKFLNSINKDKLASEVLTTGEGNLDRLSYGEVGVAIEALHKLVRQVVGQHF
jgi:hypothetical protein